MQARCILPVIFYFAAILMVGAAQPGPVRTYNLPSGATLVVAAPERGWNGDLVVYAHGYRAPDEPLDLEFLNFGGFFLPDISQQFGFAFASTTYRRNGLAVLEGVEDLQDVVRLSPFVLGAKPRRVLVLGASEGALVATLAMERHPDDYDGGIALCGPLGSLDYQTDYIFNFRVLFDVYYPGLLPPGVTRVPTDLMEQWFTIYEPLVQAAIQADPSRAQALLQVAGAAFEPGDLSTIKNTVCILLWYHIFGTNDAHQQLGGNPFDNRFRRYRGSSNDTALNQAVERVRQDPVTRLTTRPYETSGHIRKPLVVLHTTRDEVVPFIQELLYLQKARAAGSHDLYVFPIDRYGHCEFTVGELAAAIFFLAGLTR